MWTEGQRMGELTDVLILYFFSIAEEERQRAEGFGIEVNMEIGWSRLGLLRGLWDSENSCHVMWSGEIWGCVSYHRECVAWITTPSCWLLDIVIFVNPSNRIGTLWTPKDPSWGKTIYINDSKQGPLEYTDIGANLVETQTDPRISFFVLTSSFCLPTTTHSFKSYKKGGQFGEDTNQILPPLLFMLFFFSIDIDMCFTLMECTNFKGRVCIM